MSTRKASAGKGRPEGKVRPENSFVIDKETYLTMVGVIEKAEKVSYLFVNVMGVEGGWLARLAASCVIKR